MVDFEKKIPASACRKKKIASSINVIEKNSCAAARKKKKMLQSYFIIPGDFTKSPQNCDHSLPLLLLNSGFDDVAKSLLHMCNALLPITSSIINRGKVQNEVDRPTRLPSACLK